jgi:hypothetical protein
MLKPQGFSFIHTLIDFICIHDIVLVLIQETKQPKLCFASQLVPINRETPITILTCEERTDQQELMNKVN